jgi:thiamine biosynthesis lipoprotein
MMGLGLVLACTAGPSLERFEYRSIRMGTEVRILLYAEQEAGAAAAVGEAFHRIAQLDSLFSDYRTDSEIAQLAFFAGAEPLVVSDELLTVMQCALRLARETGGAFDPSVGPLSVLWRNARRTGTHPDSLELARAATLVDWQAIDIDTVHRTIRLARPGMRLDLGGIAKGYAADEALDILRAHGFPHALVSFGGEIVAAEAPPGEAGWTVRSDLLPDSTFVLSNRALSASGDAEQFLVVDGVRYSHVIDISARRGLTNGASATVFARDGMTADALATAVSLLAGERQLRFVTAHPEATFMLPRGRDQRHAKPPPGG